MASPTIIFASVMMCIVLVPANSELCLDTPKCHDVITHKDMCDSAEQISFVKKHCAKFCGLCNYSRLDGGETNTHSGTSTNPTKYIEDIYTPGSQFFTLQITSFVLSDADDYTCVNGFSTDTIRVTCTEVSPDSQCDATAEVVFVLDGSSSVGKDNFQKVRKFTQDVTREMKLEYQKLNVTVITFSNEAQVMLRVNESVDISTMVAQEANITYTHGGTETHKALNLMYQSYNHNVNSSKIAIVVTDGASFEPALTRQAAENAKKNGVTIFVIAVGDDVNPHETKDISSDPDARYLKFLQRFSDLQQIVGFFHTRNCTTTTSTTTTSTTTTTTEATTTKQATTTTTVPQTEATSKPTTVASATVTNRPSLIPGQSPSAKPVSVIGLSPTAKPPFVSHSTESGNVKTPGFVSGRSPSAAPPYTKTGVPPSLVPPVGSTAKTQKPIVQTGETVGIVTQPSTKPTTKTTTTTVETPAPTTPTTTTTQPTTKPTTTTTVATPAPTTPTTTTTQPTTNPTTTTTVATPAPTTPTTTTSKPTTKSTTTTTAATPAPTTPTTTTSKPTTKSTTTTTVATPAPTTPTTTTTKPTTKSTTTTTVATPAPTTPTTTTSKPTTKSTTTTTVATPAPTTPTTTTSKPTTKSTTTTTVATPAPTTPTTTTSKPTTKSTTTTTVATPAPTTPTTTTTKPTTKSTTTTTAATPASTSPTTTTTKPTIKSPTTTTVATPAPTTPTTTTTQPTTKPTTTVVTTQPTTNLTTTTTVATEPSTKPTTTTTQSTTTPTTTAPTTKPSSPTTTTTVPTEPTTTPTTTTQPTTRPITTTVEVTSPPTTPTTTQATMKPTTVTKSTQPTTTTTVPTTQSTPSPTTTTTQPTVKSTTSTTQSTTASTKATSPVKLAHSSPTTTTKEPTTTTTENPVTTSTIPPTTTTASCIAKIADVVFVVDTSGSIGLANFEKVKGFIKEVVMTFDIDPRYTRVALIEYSSDARIEFKLNDKTNLTDLLDAIDNVTYSGGGTSTSDALQLMRVEGFERERPAAPDIAVVITDGLSKFPSLTRAQANLAKKDGITMFSIGIGNLTASSELYAIATNKHYVFEVGDYETLLLLDNVVAHRACGIVLPEEYHSRSTTPLTTTQKGCRDLDANCANYPRDSCTDYAPYARKNCARKCGYCPEYPLFEPPCEDKEANCASFGTAICFSASQYDWVDEHCRKFCSFCGNKTEISETTVTTPTTPVVTTVSSCVDIEADCDNYGGPSMCSQPSYESWAKYHCKKYCGYCFSYHTVTSATVNRVRCPKWTLPEQCTLVYSGEQCCPYPKCPDDFKLTIKRKLK